MRGWRPSPLSVHPRWLAPPPPFLCLRRRRPSPWHASRRAPCRTSRSVSRDRQGGGPSPSSGGRPPRSSVCARRRGPPWPTRRGRRGPSWRPASSSSPRTPPSPWFSWSPWSCGTASRQGRPSAPRQRGPCALTGSRPRATSSP